MNILAPLRPLAATQPRDSQLLRSAIAAHRSKLDDSRPDRALTLSRLVLKVLGRPEDRITRIPRCSEPVAVVDGLIFRGEAENPYDLKGGWLCVLTKHNGWRDVRSIEHLGEIGEREPLAIVECG